MKCSFLTALAGALALTACGSESVHDPPQPIVRLDGLGSRDALEQGDFIFLRPRSPTEEYQTLFVNQHGEVEFPSGAKVNVEGMRPAEVAKILDRQNKTGEPRARPYDFPLGDYWAPGVHEELVEQLDHPEKHTELRKQLDYPK
jgi:hypothetical protein